VTVDGLPGVVVVPDGGGQGKDALQDPDEDPAGGSASVVFEVELAFEGVVDRLDDLPQRLKNRAPGLTSGLTHLDLLQAGLDEPLRPS
jgi:hypothetical protein